MRKIPGFIAALAIAAILAPGPARAADEQAAKAAYDSVMTMIRQGQGRMPMDQLIEKAETGLQGILDRFPGTAASGSARLVLGQIYSGIGRPDDARAHLAAFLDAGYEKDPNEVHMAWLMLGNVALEEEKFEEAREWYGKIAAADGVNQQAMQMARMSIERIETIKKLRIGAPLIPFEAVDIAGKPLAPADYKGRVVLLDFWATWCAPCRAEMPTVKGIYAKYHEKGFDIIGVSLDNDRAALDRYLDDEEILWRQVFDGKGWQAELGRIYGVSSIPATFLIDRQGRIRYKNLRGADLEEAVGKLIAEK